MSNYQELYEKWLNSSALTEEEKLQLKNISFVADIFYSHSISQKSQPLRYPIIQTLINN